MTHSKWDSYYYVFGFLTAMKAPEDVLKSFYMLQPVALEQTTIEMIPVLSKTIDDTKKEILNAISLSRIVVREKGEAFFPVELMHMKLKGSFIENDLSCRVINCLRNSAIETIGDLLKLTHAEILKIPHFGRRSLNELLEVLAKNGLKLDYENLEKEEERGLQ